MIKQVGRNDPCPCGSGKKFKKCCEPKMARGRFLATPITAQSAPQVQRAVGLTSFFQENVAAPPPARLPLKPDPVPIQMDLEKNGSHLITS